MNRLIKVTREQFILHNDSIIHRPTGSWLVAYPEMPDPCRVNIHDDVMPNGDDYRSDEIMTIGRQLLRERLVQHAAISDVNTSQNR